MLIHLSKKHEPAVLDAQMAMQLNALGKRRCVYWEVMRAVTTKHGGECGQDTGVSHVLPGDKVVKKVKQLIAIGIEIIMGGKEVNSGRGI